MACDPKYLDLPCSLSGLGYTAAALSDVGTEITLMQGHGAFFPEVGDGEYFFARLTTACGDCCEEVRVIGRDADTLTVERASASCGCFSSNSAVRYERTSKSAILAIASEAPINVVSPLHWDCETRTLSFDCEELLNLLGDAWRTACGGGSDGGDLGPQVTANTQAIQNLLGAMAGKADQSALNSLTGVVSGHTSSLSTLSGNLSALQTEVSGKADDSSLNSLSTTVQGHTASLSGLQTAVDGKAAQTDLDTLESTVAGKAEQSDLTALTSVVGTKADQSTVQQLQGAVSLKADQSTVAALDGTVQTHTGQIAVLNNAVFP